MSTLFKVSTLSDPVGADRELLVERPGWAVMRARPNSTEKGQLLWIDVLHALGHDINSSTRGRASANADLLAYSWLAAGGVDDLVVAGAHLLPPNSLRSLSTVTCSLGVRTWLVYDIESADEREEAELSLCPTTIELADFLGRRAESGVVNQAAATIAFPVTPDSHFLGFLDVAEEVLSTEDYQLVEERHRFGKEAMLQRLDTSPVVDEDSLARHLHEITAHTNDLNEVTAIVRGAQAAAFTRGWHPKVDVARWIQRGMVAGLERHLEPHEWAQVGRLYRPCETAACALTTLGFSVDKVPEVLTHQVATDGSSVQTADGEIDVPLAARPLLAAQHIFRELVQSPSDHFLVHGTKDAEVTDKWVGRLLKLVTRDTGVVLRGSSASRKSIETTRWTHRLGISVTRLAS